MDTFYKAVQTFNRLLGIRYEIVLGKKGRTVSFNINFSKQEFFHLAGLQYLTDIRELKNDREKIFDRIKTDAEFRLKLQKSAFYERIQERILHLTNLESIIDSNRTVFKYNDSERPFSRIKADFLLKNTEANTNLFLFLAYKSDGECLCRSFFSDDKIDYARNQITMSLLYKKKTFLTSGKQIILYDSITIHV